jgi:hypothetical protein
MDEAAFHRYVNLRIVYGYTFEQAVTLFLNDNFTEEEKTAVWVNNARNRIIIENTLQHTINNNNRIY